MSLPDPRAAFPPTRWSRILRAAGERDLEALARDYAGPIRAWLAARLRLGADAAAELAQEAFLWLLQKNLLDRADPARGSFRAFLKTALGNFAIERLRHDQARKRGGGTATVALDVVAEPVDPRAALPDQVLDDCWRAELLQRARERLQHELERDGRAVHWQLFRAWFLDDRGELDQSALATRHGITRTDVSNWLEYGKRRFRAVLRDLVAETVRCDDELQQELRWLFGPVHRGDGR